MLAAVAEPATYSNRVQLPERADGALRRNGTVTQEDDGAVKSYYDEFVVSMSDANTARTEQRVRAVLSLIGERRGSLLTIGAGNLVEPLGFKQAGFETSVADIADAQFERAQSLGIASYRVDLERDAIPGQYDVVCCLEVLEHLVDPLAALERVRTAVGPGGRLFVSLPDEFHIAARLAILMGRPPFSRHDWPHLRFFNLSSAHQLFRSAGLRVIDVRHMPLTPPRWPWPLLRIGSALADLLPALFSLSHVFELGASK